MSFAEKIAGLMARPGQDAVPRDDVPWYLKYAGRGLGIVGAFFAVLFGLFNCLGVFVFDTKCLISGILQMLAGFVVMAIEAPCCCMFIDYVQQIAEKADQRPYWNRAALYCIISIPPILLCLSLGSIFGCGLLFATGIIYGMMAVGKKATAEEMRNAAVQSGLSGSTTTSDRAGIINNAQPFSFTGAVATDSNV